MHVVHDPSRRANEFIKNDFGVATLVVGGTSDMFERRIRDFIKSAFLTEVKQMIRIQPVAGAVVQPVVPCLFHGGWRLRRAMLCDML